MVSKLSISEQLMYSTVRIECTYKNGRTGTGTGFYFDLLEKDNGQTVPVIITNKHVVQDSVKGGILFTLTDTEGNPDFNKKHFWDINNFGKAWTFHPDSNIDLCVMPVATLLEETRNKASIPFTIGLHKKMIPSDEELSDLTAIEDIVMIGYPIGLWDKTNNLPIIRSGITATHPAMDFNGRKEFMIDVACFPGSSGSPVFLFNPSGCPTKGGYQIGPGRIKLLGILYAGPQYQINGEIKVIDIPTAQAAISESSIPVNLGLVIKSKLILDFEPIFENLLNNIAPENIEQFESKEITTKDI